MRFEDFGIGGKRERKRKGWKMEGVGEGSRGIRWEWGGGYGPKIVCQKSSMGGSGQRLGLTMGSHEGVFFLWSKKYIFIATIELILNRLRVNPLIED